MKGSKGPQEDNTNNNDPTTHKPRIKISKSTVLAQNRENETDNAEDIWEDIDLIITKKHS